MILMTREGAGVVITPDALEAALRERYGDELHVVRETTARGTALNVGVLAGSFLPILNLSDTMTGLAIQGSWEEGAEIAAGGRGALPEGSPALVLLDDDGAGYADVPFGSTPASVAAGWKDISNYPGYAEG